MDKAQLEQIKMHLENCNTNAKRLGDHIQASNQLEIVNYALVLERRAEIAEANAKRRFKWLLIYKEALTLATLKVAVANAWDSTRSLKYRDDTLDSAKIIIASKFKQTQYEAIEADFDGLFGDVGAEAEVAE